MYKYWVRDGNKEIPLFVFRPSCPPSPPPASPPLPVAGCRVQYVECPPPRPPDSPVRSDDRSDADRARLKRTTSRRTPLPKLRRGASQPVTATVSDGLSDWISGLAGRTFSIDRSVPRVKSGRRGGGGGWGIGEGGWWGRGWGMGVEMRRVGQRSREFSQALWEWGVCKRWQH